MHAEAGPHCCLPASSAQWDVREGSVSNMSRSIRCCANRAIGNYASPPVRSDIEEFIDLKISEIMSMGELAMRRAADKTCMQVLMSICDQTGVTSLAQSDADSISTPRAWIPTPCEAPLQSLGPRPVSRESNAP